jgi:VCBS repeat-containing protein
VNDAPVAADDTASTDEDHALLVDIAQLLANDADADFDLLEMVAVTNAQSGAQVSIAGGQVRYDPGALFQHLKAGASASDSFSYTVRDAAGAESTATVLLSITGVNDAPQFITTPPAVLVIDAARAQANLDSVFEAAGAQGAPVVVALELAGCDEREWRELGLYRVDDVFGTVDGILAGAPGYAAAALERAQAAFTRRGAQAAQLTLEGGALYAFYLVEDGKRGDVLFSIAEANPDGEDRLRAAFDAGGALTVQWRDGNGHGYGHDDDDDKFAKHHGKHDDGVTLRVTGLAAPQPAAFAYDADAFDIDGDALTYRLLEAPEGATIDPATGRVEWLPRSPGQYRFVLQADDGQGGLAEQAFTLDVKQAERRLVVVGTDCNDQIRITQDAGGIVHVTVNGASRSYSGITAIRVDALGGNDQVKLAGLTMPALIEGGAGNDKLDGSGVLAARLELYGGEGNDHLIGGRRSDYLDGGPGKDVIQDGGCGDLPGAPAGSMLDWDWSSPVDGVTGERGPCKVDWDYKCGGGWGATDAWRRKPWMAGWKR